MPLLLPLALLGALEIDTLKRGFSGALDWFGILTFGLAAALVWWLWFDAFARGMSTPVAQLLRDTEAGYRPPLHWLCDRRVRAPHAALARARASGAPLESPRGAQLGGRHDAAVGALLDDLAALSRFAAQLSRRRAGAWRRICRRRAASPAATWASRSARCSSTSRGSSPCARRRLRRRAAPRCSSSTAATTARRPPPDGWHIAWEGQRRGDDTERFVLYARNAR